MITKCTGSPRAVTGMITATGKDADGILLDARDPARQHRAAVPVRRGRLLRQYMHNTEIAVTMRLSTILKTIKQPL